MVLIEFKIGPNELAKVLYYYHLLDGSGEFKIVCPFHEDVNASMKINLYDGSFYCFGCGATGDALKFVKLANKSNDELESVFKYHKIIRSKKTYNVKINEHNTIKKREVDEDALVIADDYYSGLKTINWKKEKAIETEYMLKRGFDPISLNNCGAKLTYNDSYPIIFPMKDMGVFKGWVCRTMDKKIEQRRKYLYNKGFSRANTLVGTYSNETVMLVEGYMDWLKMKQNGVKYVAAILGWKATDEQIKKLKSLGVKTIISALDNDHCGEKGTKHLQNHFDVIRFKFPKGVKDPGDMNKETFKKANEQTKLDFRRSKNGSKKNR